MKDVKTIYIVGGQKGGVGKTATCQSLCQYLIDAEGRGKDSFALIEADASIDDVGRMYRNEVETETITISDDPAKRSNPDVIYKTAVKDEKDVVVNLPSNIIDVLEAWMRDLGLIENLQKRFEGRVRLLKIFVSDGCYESIRQLKKSVSMLDNAIPHVVILNEGRVSAADFSYLDEEDLYQAILKAPNLVGVFNFPAMEPGTRYYIDKSGLGVRGAWEQSENKSEFLVAQRIQNFMAQTEEVFQAVDKAAADWFSKQAEWAVDGAATFTPSEASDSGQGSSEDGDESGPKLGKKQAPGPIGAGAGVGAGD